MKEKEREEDIPRLLSGEDEKKVVEAIKRAEAKTSGEVRVHMERHTDEEHYKHAVKLFEKMGMHRTRFRNGVLFYVAVQDHKFVVLGDKGIHAKVKPRFWEDIRDIVGGHFRKGDFSGGLVAGIEHVGRVLAEHFPYEQKGEDNELSDQISRS